MKTLESEFVKEFKNTVMVVDKDVYNIPLPAEVKTWSVSKTELYAVKGITEEPYTQLNRTIVSKLPSGYTAKRRVIDKSTRGFKIGSDGKYVYEDYKVPAGCEVVISKVKLGVSYKNYLDMNSQYGFVDFTKNGEYMYVLPDTVLYRVNQTALALSNKSMKGFTGHSVVTWKHGTLFLYIVPYKPKTSYVGTSIIKTGYTIDYSREIKQILDYWQSIGFIPNISLCELRELGNSLEKEPNLCLRSVRIGYPEYVPVSLLAKGDERVYGEEFGEQDGIGSDSK